MLRRAALAALAVVAAATLAACSDGAGGGGDRLVVYSGRNEGLIGPLLKMFEKSSGVDVDVRYGDSAELAAQILEEGGNTKADVFLSQDAGALGALATENRLEPLPQAELAKVPEQFRADDATWVGVSGRARVVVYNSDKVAQADLPKSVFDLTDPKWQGRIGIAPTNASFQSFVTAMRITAGAAKTEQWLRDVKPNVKTYERNNLIVEAVDTGEVDLGLVNHYYLYERIAEKGEANVVAKNLFLGGGDPGALVNVAGVGVVKGTKHRADADKFVSYLLSAEAQRYFTEETAEYPMTSAAAPRAGLPALADVDGPDIDLADLATLKETLELLTKVGLT